MQASLGMKVGDVDAASALRKPFLLKKRLCKHVPINPFVA
jgi:hypothetical protein